MTLIPSHWMQRHVAWLRAHPRWIGICVLEPLGIVALLSLFYPSYMAEFLTKAGFEAFGMGAAIQLIGIAFVIPFSQVKFTGWKGLLVRSFFIITAAFCIIFANLIYTLTPAYYHSLEIRIMGDY